MDYATSGRSTPTQLDIRAAGTDEATVTIWFWSPDAPAMDLRHYDDHRHGLNIMYEEPGRGLDDLVATPEGIARSHEVMLWALPATPGRQRLLELAEALRTPPLLVADPEYYHTLQPFGVWSLPDRSTPAREGLENDIDRRIEFYQGQIEQRSWYGFWFYGDIMHSYDTTRHTWRYDSGGHAWHQGELAPDQALCSVARRYSPVMQYGMFTGLEGAVGFDPATGALNDEGRELSGLGQLPGRGEPWPGRDGRRSHRAHPRGVGEHRLQRPRPAAVRHHPAARARARTGAVSR